MGISCGLSSSHNFGISVFHAFVINAMSDCLSSQEMSGLVLQMVKVVNDLECN